MAEREDKRMGREEEQKGQFGLEYHVLRKLLKRLIIPPISIGVEN